MKRSKRTSSKHPAEGHHQAPAEYDRDVRSRLALPGVGLAARFDIAYRR
jgi:hypothetical protein